MQLRTIRKRAGLSQAELARAAKTTQQTISKIESGEIADPSHTTVIRICRVLNIAPDLIDEFRVPGGAA